MVGTRRADLLVGTRRADAICGRGGNDVIRGGDGKDRIDRGTGNDELDGGPGADEVDGGSGADKVKGGAGNDRLRGGPGADSLHGCDGGRFIDRLSCGGGPEVPFSDPADVVGRDCEGRAPRDVALPGASVREHESAGTPVGTLSASDPDIGDAHTYALVGGSGGRRQRRLRDRGRDAQDGGAAGSREQPELRGSDPSDRSRRP
jgi:Ca2+-binding RTX toxin-like protein